MKKNFSMLFVGLVMALVSCHTPQTNLQNNSAATALQHEQLPQLAFKVRVSQMYPQRYYSRPVLSEFTLEVKDGWLYSNLPYIGQVHSPSFYSVSKGLNFEAPIQDFAKRRNEKKHSNEFEFAVKNEEDSYVYVVTIYDNGTADIYVRAQKRDAIRFSGDLE